MNSIMASLKAIVKNGRLKVDEPTDLPDGTESDLVPVDTEFDPEERAQFFQAIEDGAEDFERGQHMDGFEFIATMRTRREAPDR